MHSSIELDFLSGGGEMGERIRNYNWEETPLGAPEYWDQSLKTCVRIMLTSQQPIWIGWGKELIKLYNDPYRAIAGGKHPDALGKPASVVWKDIWKDIAPMLETVMERNEGTYVESQLLIMNRYGYPEETYYTFSYSPVPGVDGRTAGMICYNTAETNRIINERSLATLRRLGTEIRKDSQEEVLRSAVNILAENSRDFPFAAVSWVTEDGSYAIPFAFGGPEASHPEIPKEVNLVDPSDTGKFMAEAVREKKIVLFSNPGDWRWLREGPWDIPAAEFVHVPVTAGNHKLPIAVLTLALNPYRKFDETYRNFVQLVADQVSLELNNVIAYEEERKRAEALAEIDKAKTAFFSNISHEFRTPLTLILGPLEEILRRKDGGLDEEERKHLETTHRNALRLLKLVNALLDFSRIEAGKHYAQYAAVDISALTRNIASNFRSAIEQAALSFHVHTDNFSKPAYVDVNMWEKILFNLLSNAFKYTMEGEIAVQLTEEDEYAVLRVRDTGVGIPAEELPRMFERFHRVENGGGRSFEGTGIGLSLVKELVRLHEGDVSVTSEEGKGSVFTVRIPLTGQHVTDTVLNQPEKINGLNEDIYTAELAWYNQDKLDDDTTVIGNELPLVMVVDDNADMREHIVSVLSSGFRTITATNGKDALQHLEKHTPALIISDIMMPEMDGLELLQHLKRHKETSQVPVILLTARAGEESRIEGWRSGADDYLVKPFSANELLARVNSHVNLSKARQSNVQSVRNLFRQMPMGIAVYRGEDLEVEMVNDTMLGYWNLTREQAEGRKLWDLHPADKHMFSSIVEDVFRTGKGYVSPEQKVKLWRNGKEEDAWVSFGFEPWFDEQGKVKGLLAIATDITAQVIIRKKIEDSERQLTELANAMPQLVWITDVKGNPIYYNEQIAMFANSSRQEDGAWQWEAMLHPDDERATVAMWQKAVAEQQPYEHEHRMQLKDGSYHWFLSRAYPQKDEKGRVQKWFGTSTNIDDQKLFSIALEQKVQERTDQLNRANEILEAKNAELERQNEELASFSYVASHDLQEPLRKIQTFSNRIQDLEKNNLSATGQDYFNRMIAAAQRMHLLIEALLDYSRTNTSDRTFVETDINKLLQEAQSNLAIAIEEKKAVIEAGPLPTISVIPHQFQQLIFNILSNSLKYSKPDVPPHIHITATRIQGSDVKDLPLQKKEWYWHFSFEDNGIGFDQQYAQKVFELFQRLHGRMEYSGTGIGLAICKKIVQNHRGIIHASAQPGVGARFDVYLPE